MQVPRPPAQNPGAPANPLWNELSVKPWQYMRLKYDVSPQFKAGDIVRLNDGVRVDTYSSPTTYPGQTVENVNKDSVATVKIWKWVQRETRTTIQTMEGQEIQHPHLVSPTTGKALSGDRWADRAYVRVHSTGNTDYKTVFYPARANAEAKSYKITNGMLGRVVRCQTPTGAPVQSRVQTDGRSGVSSRSMATMTYVVEFSIIETEYVWVPSQWNVPVLHLEPLTSEETTAARTRISQTANGKTRTLTHFKEPSVVYKYHG